MRCPECAARRHTDCFRGACTCGCNPARIAATRSIARQVDMRHETVMATRGTRRPVSPQGRANIAAGVRRRVANALADRIGTVTIAETFDVSHMTVSRWVRRGDIPPAFVAGGEGSGSVLAFDPSVLGPLLVCVEMFGLEPSSGRSSAEPRLRAAVWDAWLRRDARYLHVAPDSTCRWSDRPGLADGWWIDAERIDARAAELLDRQPVTSGA